MTAPEQGSQGATARAAASVLLFRVGDGWYGIDIGSMREIVGLLPITRVPKVPAFIRGVVNLRGRVLAVIDVRLQFGLDSAADDRACIVVVDVPYGDERLSFGLIVDEVLEVRRFGPDQMQSPPELGPGVDASFLAGVVRLDDRVVVLLDPARLFAAGELALMRRIDEFL